MHYDAWCFCMGCLARRVCCLRYIVVVRMRWHGGVQYEERTLTVSMEPFRYIIYIELSTMKSNIILQETSTLDISSVIIHALAVTTTGGSCLRRLAGKLRFVK